MRFGTHETPHLRGRCRVLLNGNDVTSDCLRGEDGPKGWVELIDRPTRAVNDELVTTVIHGTVTVEEVI